MIALGEGEEGARKENGKGLVELCLTTGKSVTTGKVVLDVWIVFLVGQLFVFSTLLVGLVLEKPPHNVVDDVFVDVVFEGVGDGDIPVGNVHFQGNNSIFDAIHDSLSDLRHVGVSCSRDGIAIADSFVVV